MDIVEVILANKTCNLTNMTLYDTASFSCVYSVTIWLLNCLNIKFYSLM